MYVDLIARGDPPMEGSLGFALLSSLVHEESSLEMCPVCWVSVILRALRVDRQAVGPYVASTTGNQVGSYPPRKGPTLGDAYTQNGSSQNLAASQQQLTVARFTDCNNSRVHRGTEVYI